jgi:hypothetical protein
MKIHCPSCGHGKNPSESRTSLVRTGRFRRRSDGKSIQRFKCLMCSKYFSTATFHPCYRQKKRNFNSWIEEDLAAGVSQRRIAFKFKLSRTTVLRKFLFLGEKAENELRNDNLAKPKAKTVNFDELETFEHTKCKPLSVPLAVEEKTRRILAFEVCRMPAKGKLVRIAFKKYGPREDRRKEGRRKMFEDLKDLIEPTALLKSDQNPFYPSEVAAHFPSATHETHKGQRGSVTGQGELKKIRFDPLFSLNHTCAMLRANINRLFRRTWCTTKIPERLRLHIAIYANYHNKKLINSS